MISARFAHPVGPAQGLRKDMGGRIAELGQSGAV
jgi:hypothetical protein